MKLVRTTLLVLFSMTILPVLAQDVKEIRELRIRPELTPDTRIYYSVFVQSFYDSNGDGIGDLQGLISKLDYIKDLGAGGIWLLPVHPSPTYHKYDVVDYYGIHPDYGTLDDYRELVREAHKRDMKVLLDLVVNHASNQHPWFQQAQADPKSPFRDCFVWSDQTSDYEKEPYHWHQVRDEFGNQLNGPRYYGFFWWEMPDWNLDNKKVRKEFTDIAQFWLNDVGVDGFRLDAIRYVYPDNRLKDNLDWWKEFRKGLGKEHQDAFVVAEIWGSSEDVAPYLSHGISAGFNFELSDTIRKSLREQKNAQIAETALRIQHAYQRETRGFQDATFLTNHDMNRIMTELEGNDMSAKAAATLLLTLPGNPFIYYGEEIGMKGEKPDEFIRESFLWNVPGEDAGQTNWQISYASTSRTVKPLFYQEQDDHSVYHTYKELTRLRNSSQALARGNLVPYNTQNEAVVSFHRFGEEEEYLVFVNLSSVNQQIPSPAGIHNYEVVFRTYPAFKGAEKNILLQPHSAFILKRKY